MGEGLGVRAYGDVSLCVPCVLPPFVWFVYFAVKNSCKKEKPVCDVVGEGSSKRTATDNKQQIKTMKTLTKLALAALILTIAVAAQAGTVRGHFRSNGTYVMPHYRTPANGTPYDNLSYRGYPSQQPGYVSQRSCGSSYSSPSSFSGTSTTYGNTTYHNYQSSYGRSLSGTTMRYGNTAYTTLNGW